MRGFTVAVCVVLAGTTLGWRFPEYPAPENPWVPRPAESRFSWEWTGPEGGFVEQVVVDPVNPQNVYAVTMMDIWRTFGGSDWQVIDQFKYVGGNKAVVAVGENRAVAAIENGLWYTPNSGESWSLLMNFDDFACMSETPGETVLVVFESGGSLELVATRDGGFNWDTLNTLPYDWAHSLAFSPTTDSTILLGAELNDTILIARSSDRGQTWARVWVEDTALDVDGMSDIEVNPWRPEEIFVSFGFEGAGPSGLFHSTDGGVGWELLQSSWAHQVYFPMDVEFKDEDHLLVANLMPGNIVEGVRVPGPEEWIFTPVYSQTAGGGIEILSSDSIWAGTACGVVRSTDGGGSWDKMNSGLKAVTPLFWFSSFDNGVTEMAANTIYVVNGLGNPVYKTEDGGQTWANRSVPDLMMSASAASYPGSPDTAYLGGLGVSGTAKQWTFHFLYKTTDGGQTWTPVDTLVGDAPDSLLFFTDLWVSSTNSRTLLASLDGELLIRSTDGGHSWDTLFTFLQYPPVGTDTVFVHEADYIRVSYDAGGNWNQLLRVPTRIEAMSYNPDSAHLFGVWGDSLYRVTLTGDVTSVISLHQPRWYSLLDATARDRIFLSYYGFAPMTTYFLRSFDHGRNFETDTLNVIAVALCAGDDEVVLGDLGKSFRRSEDAFTAIHEEPVASEDGPGLSILPTPFSDQLTVQFVTKQDAWAEVVLYDLTGRRVRKLFAGPIGAGSHKFGFDTRKLPQSVYFYTAQIEERLYRGKLTKISP